MSGRFEVGYKQAFANYAITPFAAIQFSELHQSGYSETSTTLGGAPGVLGLTYGSKTISSLPTFLGAQFDAEIALPNGMVWSPYARLAWVHEFEPTRAVTASFIAVPGASFTVDGARRGERRLRVSLGSKLSMSASAAALFVSLDGEFSGRGTMCGRQGRAEGQLVGVARE